MAVSQSLTVTEVAGSVNTANNTSKVRILWTSTQSGESRNDYTRTAYYYVSINGGAETQYSVSYTLPRETTKTIVDVTLTVTHNENGAGTVRVRTWMDTGISAGVVEKSQTLTLTTIARASEISSAANLTLGSICNVKWTPKSASFRYKLKFSIGSWSYTTGVIHPNQTSEYTYTGYTIPLSVANQIPNATGTMTVALYTYSDSGGTSQVGTAATKTFTATVPNNSSTKPDISMSLSPASALPSAFDELYIQGKSKVQAELSATGKYGATIKSYSIYTEGKGYYAEDSYTSAYLSTYGIVSVTGYATDSRGYTSSVSQNITVIPYSNPRINAASGEDDVLAARCDAEGNLDESGTYLIIKAKRSYTPVMVDGVQKNFCAIRFRYMAQSDANWTEWTTILSSSAPTDEVITAPLLGGALSTKVNYVVQVGVIDDIGGTANTIISVPSESVYMHRDGRRKAMALGKYIEEDDCLDVGWGKLIARGSINGIYFIRLLINNTNILQLQSKFSAFDGIGYSRQTILLFGTANRELVQGVLVVSDDGSVSWSGVGTVTGAALDGGIVEITLPATAYDSFVCLSGDILKAI